jgi:hypothetical protein
MENDGIKEKNGARGKGAKNVFRIKSNGVRKQWLLE